MTAIKESSDELNPTVAVPATEIPARKSRTAGDVLALAIADVRVGYLPIAPGLSDRLSGLAYTSWFGAVCMARSHRMRHAVD
jgi:hypothetical protein